MFREKAFDRVNHIFKIRSLTEVAQTGTEMKIKNRQPVVFYYGILTEGNEIIILTIDAAKISVECQKITSVNEKIEGLYLDERTSFIWMLTENLDLLGYSLKTKTINGRKRTMNDALRILCVD